MEQADVADAKLMKVLASIWKTTHSALLAGYVASPILYTSIISQSYQWTQLAGLMSGITRPLTINPANMAKHGRNMDSHRSDSGTHPRHASTEVQPILVCHVVTAANVETTFSRRIDIAKVFLILLLALGFAMKSMMDIIAVLMFSIMVATTCPDLHKETGDILPFLTTEQV
ncbi:hypothetical protein BJ170DRAFT_482937 [Xylariales sp. AK1849]|nr:hypothetical protein BJ170DRAFT_482937 [Xylariales sp. AK1849]